MRYLFQSWDEVSLRIEKTEGIFLLLDYDGTITPIAGKPGMAQLPLRTKRVLQRISQHSAFKLAIISGRNISEIKALVGIENIAYAGNHGLEIECPRGNFVHPDAGEFQPLVKKLEQELEEKLGNIDGLLIENKIFTLSVHYRLVKESEVEKIREAVLAVVESGGGEDKLKLSQGKKVFEIGPPVAWNKGKAVEWLLDIYGEREVLPIFAGDDVTDEDGFEVMQRLGGISIFVGQENTLSSAAYYLNSPDEVCCFLEKLLQAVFKSG